MDVLYQQPEEEELVRIYKVTFYRYNTRVKPMMKASVDVVFRTDSTPDDENLLDDEAEATMWKELWNQNPAWLLSHGPSTFGFHGWSSVMWKRESLVEVKIDERDTPEDLTGKGNMATALTFHPWLPSDMKTALKKAYERGAANEKL